MVVAFRRRVAQQALSLLILASLTALPAPARADEIIDRVLAVVGGDLITLSDVRAARELGLVDPGNAADPTRAILAGLIDRTLVINEVNRYAPPEPGADEVERRIAALRNTLGSNQALDETLTRVGVSFAQLGEIVRDDLRIRAYLAQRFTADTPEHSQTAITEWINGLRRRAEIADLYVPPATP